MSEKSAIAIHGAREGCLQGVDLEIPLGQLSCLTGPAGGGARTLAVDVLYREGRRRYLQALSAFEREYHEGLQKAEADEILGLPPAILIPGAPPRRTVADFIRFSEVVALLFMRHGKSTCPVCAGPCTEYSLTEAVRHAVESFAGTRALVAAPVELKAGGEPAAVLEEIQRAGFARILVAGEVIRSEEIASDAQAQLGDTLQVVVDRVDIGEDSLDRIGEALRTARVMSGGRSLLVAEGKIIPLNQQLTCTVCGREYPDVSGEELLDPGNAAPEGGRVRSSLAGSGLNDVLEMRIDRAIFWLDDVRKSTSGKRDALAEGAVQEAAETLSRLAGLGLHHVLLQRSTADLASGEWLRMVLALTASRDLSGVLYIVEPCSGLDETNLQLAIQILGELVAAENTVVVIDNAPLVVAASNRVFAFRGGEVFSGPDPTIDEFVREKPLRPICVRNEEPAASIRIFGGGDGKRNNLRTIDVEIPTGKLVVITGSSGAGATSLLRDAIAPALRTAGVRRELQPRQKGAGRGLISVSTGKLRRLTDLRDLRRHEDESVVQTLGLLGPIATLFSKQATAQAFGLKAEWFHLDRPGGRCRVCEGNGELRFAIDFLDDVAASCPGCEGRRYSAEALEITHRGRSPSDILDMTVHEATRHFSREPGIGSRLDMLSRFDMGGYRLGQATCRLEVAERLRLQLAVALWRASEKDLLLLDSPLAGAHPDDVSTLVDLLSEIVSRKATVIVADRHPRLLQSADRVLVIGPGSGPDGGLVVAEGVSEQG